MPLLISFVIPAFNAEHTITEAMRSVLAQTHRELEVIIIDDGSTDGTFAKAAAVDDARITIARRSNRGVAASRNLGLVLAKGDFICFLDADDAVLPEFAIRTLDAIGECDAISTAYLDTNELLEPASRAWCPARNELQLDRLRLSNPLAIGATVFRADAIREVTRHFGDAFPSHCHVEDWELLLRFTSLGARWAPPIEEQLMLCRLMPQSRSTQAQRVWRDGLLLLDRWVPQVERSAARRNWTVCHLARALANGLSEFAGQLLKEVAPVGEADIPAFTGTLRVWAQRYTTVAGERLPVDELRTRLTPLGVGVASELASAAALPSWADAARRAMQFVGANQRLVVYGFGRNGREACSALTKAGVNFAIIDDARAFDHPSAINSTQLTPFDVVLVTPDAHAEILARLRGRPVRVLTRTEIYPSSQSAA